VKRKLSETKAKKSEKSEKKQKNRLEFCFEFIKVKRIKKFEAKKEK
jgi:hypothetical protein